MAAFTLVICLIVLALYILMKNAVLVILVANLLLWLQLYTCIQVPTSRWDIVDAVFVRLALMSDCYCHSEELNNLPSL